ncbi:hypothetical protein PFMC_05402 [Plasmodium falciparum CAMP/Malaysia]|uniref:Uncharacterized protein n=1 Tax=Plasmodium falciparum (isolate Camp / Malaysia) TaxID=5835 RepID=A0A024WYT0_PLAFC|nr:hypothetical protein PFMC_05402 [Plasmodium falciparum CAMP/Malaysia]
MNQNNIKIFICEKKKKKKCNISKMIILENMSFGTHFTKTEIYINK